MDGCIHKIDLCPDCDGLRTHRWQKVEGVQSITLGEFGTSSETCLFIAAPDPCSDTDDTTA